MLFRSCVSGDTIRTVLQAFSLVVTAWLVIHGWEVAHQKAALRDRRKEVREFVEDLKEAAFALESLGRKYWLMEPGDESDALAAEIRLKMSRLSLAVTRLKNAEDIDAITAIKNLRIAITGDDFDVLGRTIALIGSAKLMAIGQAAIKFESDLEGGFMEQFPSQPRLK